MSRKRVGRRQAPKPVEIIKIGLLATGALLLGWQVVTTSAVNALVRRNPLAAAAVAPDHPAVVFKLAMVEFRQQRGGIAPDTANRVKRAFNQAPLAEEPLMLNGVSALVSGRADLGERLFTAARDRNPRSRLPHLMLLDRYLRSDRVSEAASEITILARLLPQATPVLTSELAKFSEDPKSRLALGKVLRTDPGTRHAVLSHLAQKGAGREVVLSLAQASGALPGSPNDSWKADLLNGMVGTGRIKEALAVWQGFADVKQREASKAVHDERFGGLPGAPPFGWSLLTNSAGLAERRAGGGLEVEYYGRADADLASQLLVLGPGRYRLSVRAEGEAIEASSYLAWRILCHGSNAAIAEMPIKNLTFQQRVISADFAIPATGCSAQWLKLVGVPAEFPKTQAVVFPEVRVGRATRS